MKQLIRFILVVNSIATLQADNLSITNLIDEAEVGEAAAFLFFTTNNGGAFDDTEKVWDLSLIKFRNLTDHDNDKINNLTGIASDFTGIPSASINKAQVVTINLQGQHFSQGLIPENNADLVANLLNSIGIAYTATNFTLDLRDTGITSDKFTVSILAQLNQDALDIKVKIDGDTAVTLRSLSLPKSTAITALNDSDTSTAQALIKSTKNNNVKGFILKSIVNTAFAKLDTDAFATAYPTAVAHGYAVGYTFANAYPTAYADAFANAYAFASTSINAVPYADAVATASAYGTAYPTANAYRKFFNGLCSIINFSIRQLTGTTTNFLPIAYGTQTASQEEVQVAYAMVYQLMAKYNSKYKHFADLAKILSLDKLVAAYAP